MALGLGDVAGLDDAEGLDAAAGLDEVARAAAGVLAGDVAVVVATIIALATLLPAHQYRS